MLEQHEWIATAVSTDERAICTFCRKSRRQRPFPKLASAAITCATVPARGCAPCFRGSRDRTTTSGVLLCTMTTYRQARRYIVLGNALGLALACNDASAFTYSLVVAFDSATQAIPISQWTVALLV